MIAVSVNCKWNDGMPWLLLTNDYKCNLALARIRVRDDGLFDWTLLQANAETGGAETTLDEAKAAVLKALGAKEV